jgi:chaperonin GroES
VATELKKKILQPLYDKIIIRKDKPKEKILKDSKLVLPEVAQAPINQGIVIAVGEGKVSESGQIRRLQTRPGQRVLFGKYTGFEIEFEGSDLIVMREEDVFAVIYEVQE